jgi:hypothetical protein
MISSDRKIFETTTALHARNASPNLRIFYNVAFLDATVFFANRRVSSLCPKVVTCAGLFSVIAVAMARTLRAMF